MSSPLLDTLRAPGPTVSVELRPPRSGLDPARSMDVWIDMHHTIRRFSRDETVVFLTDDAVGASEEESLTHLSGNLDSDTSLARVAPFLTAKHTLDYCRKFMSRAESLGVGGLTVVGGDTSVGPPRCFPHAQDLRKALRQDSQTYPLGGWANPHRDVDRQVGFVSSSDFYADFVLTQIVSHHSLDRVDAFQSGLRDAGVSLPVLYGVFYYRSGTPSTLDLLGEFFPVPKDGILDDFASGKSPEEICAESIRALRERGAEKVYVSNLRPRDAHQRLEDILSLV